MSKEMITFADFFSGIGGIRLGFENAKTENKSFTCVFSNEIDEKAILTYEKNFKGKVCCKSISDLKETDIPDFDIFVGGFPCQAFSQAGLKKGFQDLRDVLFFDIIRILELKKPEAFLLENVKNLKTHDNGRTYKIIKKHLIKTGYYFKSKIINSSEYGNTPQNRERIFIVGFRQRGRAEKFRFPSSTPLKKTIKDISQYEIPEKYYYTQFSSIYPKLSSIAEKLPYDSVYQYRRYYIRENKSGLCPTLTANMGSGGHNIPIIKDEKGIRKLTPMECFRLQTFPDFFSFPSISDCHLYKQIGNSVTVVVIKRIAEKILSVW